MSTTEKLFKDIGVIAIYKIIITAQSFLFISLLTKYLSPEDYGIWSQIKITVILITGISMLGLDSAIIRFISGKYKTNEISSYFITITFISLTLATIFGVIVLFFSNTIANLLTGVSSANIFFKFIIAILITRVFHSLFSSLFRAKERIKEFSIIESIKSVFELIFVFILLYKNYNILAAIIATISSNIMAIILYSIRIKKQFTFSWPSKTKAKEVLKFSLPYTVAPMLFWILQTGDQYVLGILKGASVVGAYAVAYSLSSIIRLAADPVFLVMAPAMTNAYNNNFYPEVKQIFSYSYRAVFMIAIPLLVGITILAKPILTIISREEYAQTPLIFPIISLGVLMYLFFNISTSIIHLEKRLDKISKLLIFLSIINLVLNVLLIPSLSTYGAAIATLITFSIAGLYGMSIIKQKGYNLMPARLCKYTISAILMGIITYLIQNLNYWSSITKLITILLVCPSLYFILLILLKEIGKNELNFIKKLI